VISVGGERECGGRGRLCLDFGSMLLSEEGINGPNIVSTVQRKGGHM